jgi:hypothetical protein
MDVNPYESPREYALRPNQDSDFPSARLALIAIGGGAFCFVMWCVLDFVLVRFAPSRIHDFDWICLLLPVIVLLGGIAALRGKSIASRIVLSIVATIIAIILAVVLIVTVGISFHFSIGGEI